MGKKKYNLFIDLDRMVIGSFIKQVQKSEEEYVEIEYVPLQGFKKHTYPKAVLKKDIISKQIPDCGLPGTETDVTILFSGEEGSVCKDILDTSKQKEVLELRKENKMLKMQLAGTRTELEQASQSVEQVISRANDLTKKNNDRNEGSFPQNPFGEDTF